MGSFESSVWTASQFQYLSVFQSFAKWLRWCSGQAPLLTGQPGWKRLWTTAIPPVPKSPIPATRDALHCVTPQLPPTSFFHFTQIFLYYWAEDHLLWGYDRINTALHNAHTISVSSPQLMVYFLLIQFKHLPKIFKLFLATSSCYR